MPDDLSYFDDDVVDLRLDDGSTQQFYWGDACVRLPAQDQNGTLADTDPTTRRRHQASRDLSATPRKLRDSGLLRLAMVDVQQGDGLILQTPDDKVVFIDGGDNILFARFVAAAFPGTSDAHPAIVDAMVITHGDADHFAGLSQLRKSETLPADKARKRVFVAPKRVYHNGLVKRPSKDPATGKRP